MAPRNSDPVKHNEEDCIISRKTGANLNFDLDLFQDSFDRKPFGFTHDLSSLDLFADRSLARLAETMSKAPRDYFIAGSAPTPGTSFYSVPNGGVNPCEAIQTLEKSRYRILLKRPEDHDDRFRDLLHTLFQQVVDARGGLGGQRIERLESAIFISSGATITPIHFDPEIAFFSQISGEKFYNVYPPDCARENELERFYIRGRNDIGAVDLIGMDPARVHTFRLSPGKGLHQPQNAPHWVQTGDSRSVSYTFLFQTDATRAASRTRALNYCIRKVGLRPSPIGVRPVLDAVKASAMRAAVPLQLAGKVWNKAIRVLTGRRLSGN